MKPTLIFNKKGTVVEVTLTDKDVIKLDIRQAGSKSIVHRELSPNVWYQD